MTEQKTNNRLLEEIKMCCRTLEDKKALDLKVLYLGEKSSVTDYFIIATGNSEPHIKAMHNALVVALKELKVSVLGTQANIASGWLVIDAFDFIVHLFTAEMRDYYGLESLWKDGQQIDFTTLISA